MKSGFFGIGVINMKNPLNYGTLFRTAHTFGADFIFLIGERFKLQRSDTTRAYKHLPLYQYSSFEEFEKNKPLGCDVVAIELTPTASSLTDFKHPKQAIYLLGAEDDGIPEEYLSRCSSVVKIPFGEKSINVSTSGSIVLYDRLAKKMRQGEKR